MGGAGRCGQHRFFLACRRAVSLLGATMKQPIDRRIDSRLVFCSLLFGVGWCIAGFCPGPAKVALGMGEAKAVVFVPAMLAGKGFFEAVELSEH